MSNELEIIIKLNHAFEYIFICKHVYMSSSHSFVFHLIDKYNQNCFTCTYQNSCSWQILFSNNNKKIMEKNGFSHLLSCLCFLWRKFNDHRSLVAEKNGKIPRIQNEKCFFFESVVHLLLGVSRKIFGFELLPNKPFIYLS